MQDDHTSKLISWYILIKMISIHTHCWIHFILIPHQIFCFIFLMSWNFLLQHIFMWLCKCLVP